MTANNRRILLNAAATYGRSLYALLCGLLTSRWVLSALGQDDFGLYGVVGGLIIFISFINTLLSWATSRFYAFVEGKAISSAFVEGIRDDDLEECRMWFSSAVVLHSVVPVLLVTIGYPIGMRAVECWLSIPFDRLDACKWVFRFACLSSFFGMINVPFQAMYTAKQRIAELTIYSFVQTTVNLLFVWYMFSHPGEWLVRYALWMCVISIFPQLIICARALKVFPECRFRVKYAFNWSRLAQLSSFALWQAFGGLGAILRNQGIQILINKYFDPAHNASMSIANQVSVHSQTLASSMQGAFSPAITNECGAGKYDEMRKLAYRTCKFGMVLALIFVIPLFNEMQAVLTVWLGNPPPQAVEICRCVLLMSIIDKSTSGHMLAVGAAGKIAAYQFFLGGTLILTLPMAWCFVVMDYGFVSVGYAMVLTMIVCTLGRVWFARTLVGMSARYWLGRIMFPIAVMSVIVFISGYSVQFVMPSCFTRICVTTVICETLFFPLTWLLVLDVAERRFVVSKAKRLLGVIT